MVGEIHELAATSGGWCFGKDVPGTGPLDAAMGIVVADNAVYRRSKPAP